MYTAIVYACSDFMILAYTAVGYTNNDNNLGCTTVEGGKLLGALIRYRIVAYVSSVCQFPLGMPKVK